MKMFHFSKEHVNFLYKKEIESLNTEINNILTTERKRDNISDQHSLIKVILYFKLR